LYEVDQKRQQREERHFRSYNTQPATQLSRSQSDQEAEIEQFESAQSPHQMEQLAADLRVPLFAQHQFQTVEQLVVDYGQQSVVLLDLVFRSEDVASVAVHHATPDRDFHEGEQVFGFQASGDFRNVLDHGRQQHDVAQEV
jgi:hypothetical protein